MPDSANVSLVAQETSSRMLKALSELFGTGKPVIAMVHLAASPGTPLYDADGGVDQIVANANRDLEALQAAGVDAVMFGNENDRPYELKVDPATVAVMAYVIGRLSEKLSVPFGVNALWDPVASMAVAASTGASFVREIFTGAYASDMGIWSPNAADALRYRKRLDRDDLKVFYNVSAEFADSLDRRRLPERARSAVFSSIPDAILISGVLTGEPPAISDIEEVKKALPDTPVFANTGIKIETVERVLNIADGVIVGSSLKYDGKTWNPVDPERAQRFMERARAVQR